MGRSHGKMLIVNATRQNLELSGEAVQCKTTVTWHSQKEVDVAYGKAVVVTLPNGREIHFKAESQVLIDESRTGEVSKKPMRDDYRVLYINTDHIQVFEEFQTTYMQDKLASASRKPQCRCSTGPTISHGKANEVCTVTDGNEISDGNMPAANETGTVVMDTAVAAIVVGIQMGKEAWEEERRRQRDEQFKKVVELLHFFFARAPYDDLEKHHKTIAEVANNLTDFLHEGDICSLARATAWGSIRGALRGLLRGVGVSTASFRLGRWARAKNKNGAVRVAKLYRGLSGSVFFVHPGALFASEVASCVHQFRNSETHGRTCVRRLVCGGVRAGVDCAVGGLAFLPVAGTVVAVIGGVAWNLLDTKFHLSGDLARYFVEETDEEMHFQTQDLTRKLMRKARLAFNFQENEAVTYQHLKQRYRKILLRLHPDKNNGQQHPHFHTLMAIFAILLADVEGRLDDVNFKTINKLTQEALEDCVGRPHHVMASPPNGGFSATNDAGTKQLNEEFADDWMIV